MDAMFTGAKKLMITGSSNSKKGDSGSGAGAVPTYNTPYPPTPPPLPSPLVTMEEETIPERPRLKMASDIQSELQR